MQQQLQQRLTELHTEFEAGHKMLTDLEAKQANLRETLLRLSGAIQVLEEELVKAEAMPDEASNAEDESLVSELASGLVTA